MTTFFGLVGFAFILTIGISMMLPMMGAQPPQLYSPVECKIGVECFIQNYVDLDADEAEATDHRCGFLTYDGHKGTDFRTRDMVQMEKGVNVLAVADGTVLRLRDGMADTIIKDNDASDVEGIECGNGMVIRHRNGYETQYCHLKQNSIAVKEGDEVKVGDVLGQIGLSGHTEFPHLHLTLTNKDGVVLDPFAGNVKTAKCAKDGRSQNLWHASVRKDMAYQATGLLSYGFADKKPNQQGASEGKFSLPYFSATSDPVIFWTNAFGLQEGDDVIMQLMAPSRIAVVNHSQKIQSNKAQWFQFVGKRLSDEKWQEGTYLATYRVVRGEGKNRQTIIDEKMVIDVVDTGEKATR